MQRILEPGQIEAFAQRAIPRLRVPDRTHVFSRRAERLRELAGNDAIGHVIGDYLRLMATVVDAQQAAVRGEAAERGAVDSCASARHAVRSCHALGARRALA